MLSSSGISWRQGPHQLAQKLSITTWPLYCLRLIFEPPRASSANCGAGPLLPVPAPVAGTAPSSAVARAVAIKVTVAPVRFFAAIRFFMSGSCPYLSLKENGRPERRFHVVGELGYTQQVRAEHPVLHLDVNR